MVRGPTLKVYEKYLMADNTIDVVASQCIWDYSLFFGPTSKPFEFFEINNKILRVSDILLALELVSTRTWCRKNNWDWEIPAGYKEFSFGTKKIRICCLISPPKRYTVEEIDGFERQNLLKGE